MAHHRRIDGETAVFGNEARAYYYEDVIEAGVVNDQLGETPVLVGAEGENINDVGCRRSDVGGLNAEFGLRTESM